MPKVLRAVHVSLAMPKGEEAKARMFYGQLLGLREIPKPPSLAARGGVWFEVDGFQVHLTVDETAATRPTGGRPALALEVSDTEAFRKEVLRRQLNAQDAPPLPGTRRFYALDPFGNRIEILQRG